MQPDFFHSYGGFFHSYAGEFTKKVRFRPESQKETFSAVTIKFGTFSTLTKDFSTVEMGVLGRFVLIPFHSYDGNPIPWDFHRNCRKTSLSIVIAEKVRREGQQVGIFSYRDRG